MSNAGGTLAVDSAARDFYATLASMKHSPGFLALVEEAKKNVREDHEFAQDHVAGARHIGRGVLERDIETLLPDKDTTIVLYCGGGFRSALAADNLRKMGYRNVCSMDGGIRAWREAGFPIKRT